MKSIRLEKRFLNFITPMQWHKRKYQQIPKVDIYHDDKYLGEILHLPNLNHGDFEEIFEKLCKKFKTYPSTYEQLRADIGDNFPSHVYYFLNFLYADIPKEIFPLHRCHELLLIDQIQIEKEMNSKYIKLKVGRLNNIDEEIEQIEQLIQTNPSIMLRIDSNEVYNEKQYITLENRFKGNIDYIECSKNELDYNLASNKAYDIQNISEDLNKADIIVVKPSLVGDFKTIEEFLRNCTRPVIFSSTFETKIYQHYILKNFASIEQIHGLMSFAYRKN